MCVFHGRCEEDHLGLGADARISIVYPLGLVVYVGFHNTCTSHGQLQYNH